MRSTARRGDPGEVFTLIRADHSHLLNRYNRVGLRLVQVRVYTDLSQHHGRMPEGMMLKHPRQHRHFLAVIAPVSAAKGSGLGGIKLVAVHLDEA